MKPTAIEFIVLVLYILWFIGSVIIQFKKLKLFRFDILGLLPLFHFFAPRPVTRDLRVYCRARKQGEFTAWKPIFTTVKSVWCFIWNPSHRLRKAIFDLYEEMEPFRQTPDIWHITFPYLVFLNAAQNTFKDIPDIEKIQFVIACYAGFEDSTHDILFISNLHKID